MKLIDRYVSEVGKRLVLVRGRADIEKELRSTLEDMLEDRAEKAGRPADEALEMDLLREYGSPDKVAGAYNPHPYLIGPRFFPLFVNLLKIVLGAVALGLTVATGVQLIAHPPVGLAGLLAVLGQWLLNIISAFIGAFGNIALIFALIERFAPASELEFGGMRKVGGKFTAINSDVEAEWDPAVLVRKPEPQEVPTWEPVLAIVFISIVIGVFNFNRQWLSLNYSDQAIWFIGIGDFVPGKIGSIPLFSEAFYRWLPLLNLAWLAEIGLHAMLLRSGRWNMSTRLFSIGIKVLQIVINLALLSGPLILGISAEALAATNVINAGMAQGLVSGLQQLMPVLLGLGVFGKLIEIAQAGRRLITQDLPSKA